MKDFESYAKNGRVRERADKVVIKSLESRGYTVNNSAGDNHVSGLGLVLASILGGCLALGVSLIVFCVCNHPFITDLSEDPPLPSPVQEIHEHRTVEEHYHPVIVRNVTNVKERIEVKDKRDCIVITDVENDKEYLRCDA